MLVSFSTSFWSGKATDDSVEDELTKSHGTEKDVHEYRKRLVRPEDIKEFKSVRSQFRAYLKDKTSPWLNDGTRVMASPFYFEVVAREREFRAAWESALAKFFGKYPSLKAAAKKRMGSLYRDEDFPSIESLKKRFDWEFNVLPIPDKSDWRVDLGKKDNVQIERQIEEKVKQGILKATADLWQRMYEVVQKMAERMKDVDGTFRDSIIENIRELVKILPQMNIAGDPKLDQMAKEIEVKLCRFNPEALREDDKERRKAADAADEILKKLSAYVGGGR
jgi:hypothetical protein